MAADVAFWVDTFDRADAVDLGIDWTGIGWKTIGNVAVPRSPGQVSVWNKYLDRRAYGRDYYVQGAVTKATTANGAVGLVARYYQRGSSEYYYSGLVRTIAGGGNDQLELWQTVAGVTTQLGADLATQEWVDGDILRLEVVGTTIRLKSAPAADPTTFTQIGTDRTGDDAALPSWINGTAGLKSTGVVGGAGDGAIEDWACGFLTGVLNIVWLTVGAVTSATALIAFRASAACTVKVEYSTNSGLAGSSLTSGVAVSSTTDFTGVVSITGLTPDTIYYCRLLVDDVPKAMTAHATFRTSPIEGIPTTVTVGFSSCYAGANFQNFDTTDATMGALLASAPRCMIFLGDAIYVDQSPLVTDTLAEMRAKHFLQLSGGNNTYNYAQARQSFPWYHMWDDHDISDNYSGGLAGAFYVNGKQAWQEYPARGNPAPYRAGVLYYTFQLGDIGFFVLDGRSYRSVNGVTDNASKTLLGATQKQDLKDWLLATRSLHRIKVLCSSTTTSAFGGTGNDSWGGGFTTELNEIRDYIIANNIPGVIWLAADGHWALISRTVRSGVNFYEVMACPMAQVVMTKTASTDPAILFKYDTTPTYGLVTIDTRVVPATVRISVRDSAGTEVGALAITTDDINTGLQVETHLPQHAVFRGPPRAYLWGPPFGSH